MAAQKQNGLLSRIKRKRALGKSAREYRKSLASTARAAAHKKRQRKAEKKVFEAFNPATPTRPNISQGFFADGVFHPIRASKDYNEFLGGDFDDAKTRKEKSIAHQEKVKGHREFRTWLKKQKTFKEDTKTGKTLSQFVRGQGGIAPGKQDMHAGEIKRLGSKQSGTTGLINQHNKAGGHHSYSAEYMMDAANVAGFRDEKGDHFSNIGDFLRAVEHDASGIRKIHSYADNPARGKRLKETPLFDMFAMSAATAKEAGKLQRVRDIHKGEEGQVVKTFPDGWVKIKLDSGGHWMASPNVIQRLNPKGNRIVIVVNQGATKAKAKGTKKGATKTRRNVEGYTDETGFHPIRGSKGYSDFEAGELRRMERLHKKRTRRNPSLDAKLAEKFREFRGFDPTKKTQVAKSRFVPQGTWVLGQLPFLALMGGKQQTFGSGFYLVGDAKGDLHIVKVNRDGSTRAPFNPFAPETQKNGVTWIDEVKRFPYRSKKVHIGKDTVYVWIHKAGEEGGDRPIFGIDDSGYPVLRGGSYELKREGIRN